MAQTILPLLTEAAHAYGLTVRACRQIRRVWRLETNRGCFALKAAPPEGDDVFLRLAEEHLLARSFNRFPRRLPTADGAPECVLASGDRFVLRPWLPGASPALDLEHPRDLRRLARAVAEMHQASLEAHALWGLRPDAAPWPGMLGAMTADLQAFHRTGGREGRFARAYEKAAPGALAEAADARRLLDEAGGATLAAAAEAAGGFCHGDLAPNNALIHGAHAYLLDLDRAAPVPFPMDIAQLIRRAVAEHEWSPDLAEALREGYESVRPLPDMERRATVALLHWPQPFWRLGRQYFVERLARSERFFAGRLWHWENDGLRRRAFLRHCLENWW